MTAFPGKPEVRWRAVISIICEYEYSGLRDVTGGK
jgi:hypothetical protein